MSAKGRLWLFITGLLMSGLGFWASTFAGTFINDNPQLTIGLYLFGLALIMGYVTISGVAFARLEKRISTLEGDQEEPKK